ncbi:zonadhesin [Salarias fasciatus]|uniref:zonadhesin n=1 Tax=Salarias fasciatus TaxID=181472 RepID=UPI001176F103|nr:zonadhesin-like [Salarias fasciatus]
MRRVFHSTRGRRSQCPEGRTCGGRGGTASSGTCTVHQHTDGSTFDGVLFRFAAPCTYVLAKTCSPAEALQTFSVEVVNERDGNASLPRVQQVVVDVGDVRVSLLNRQTQRVVVNGVWRKLPLSLGRGVVNITSNPAAVSLETSFGLSVSYDSAGAVQVTLPPSYSRQVCGMCGNFNHLKDDDLLRPNGTTAENATALAGTWQAGEAPSSCETVLVPDQCDPLQEAEYSSELYCGGLVSSSGPFAGCSAAVGAESYFRACLVSMCSSHGDPAALCQILQSYTGTCQEAGVAVPAWRNSSFCSPQCAADSHYNSCADGCPEVCSAQDLPGSCGSCEERCECDSGFKLSGGKCVPEGDCGCWYNEKHYEKGETLMEGECDKQCKCMGENEMQCSRVECGDNEVCKVRDGLKGCFPVSPATCSVYGDPHYITFDHRAYDFQGGCSYTLTTTCVEGSAVQFSIIGHNKHPSVQNATRSKLEAVTLQVEDLHLTLNQCRELFVNDTQFPLPHSASGTYGSVKVDMKNNFMVLETSFGLRVMLDGENRLFLQVDERYKYKLCGLCGTYSGHQDDDFVTPGGQKVTDPFSFGDSWKVQDINECIAHPTEPTTCDEDQNNVAYDQCLTIFGDAFRACHEHIHPGVYLNSCVYDYCATDGDPHTLCESLKSYAAACQVAGVKLPSWEIGTACVCPMNCNFDDHLCGWEQLIQDSFDWTRHSGPTPSEATGPNQDHTTGAGSYMYIEASSVTHGDSARLMSSACHYTVPVCLQFWYHMYGSAKAMALNIYLLKDNRATKVWSRTESQGPEWHQGNIDISASSPFQIIVEGIRGSNDQSDVAVDDISIHFGNCSVCSLDCSFDRSLCGWSQMLTDAFDWTWQRGSTPTLMTGPSADHTGDGRYLYIEASSVTHGDTARLISSECWDSGPQCLQFWYHMYGAADTMGLHVYLLQNKVADAVFWQRNNQGDMWHLAQVDIQTTGAFQIIYEGRRGSNDQSDVAIDDVFLHRGHCAESQTTNTPKPTPTTTPKPSSTPPQPQTTEQPHPPTSTLPQNQTAVQPPPPSTTPPQPHTTVEPHPPSTTRPQPHTTAEPAPSCPENSHYTTCMPACGPTCSSLNGPPDCTENEQCAPGCVCNDGFVQNWSVCVPVQECGCVDEKGNKYQFNDKWYTNHCQEKCECGKDDGRGKIKCDDKDECGRNAVCLQDEKGNYYCQSTGFDECTMDRDSEYKTFDRMRYDFEGEHSYVLIRTRSLPMNLPDIYIEVINSHSSDHHQLKIRVYNHTMMFKKNRKLTINGETSDTPASPAGGLDIWERRSRLYLKTDFGLLVEFDGHNRAEIVLPSIYKRRIGGLCGNYDGRRQNDRMKPDGSMAHSIKEFVDSWRV